MRTALLASLLVAVAAFAAEQPAATPRFADGDQVVRPKGYHEWVFVGSSLGMSYSKHSMDMGEPEFHNVYISPAAYREFKEKGTFPEGTVLVLELVASGGNASINKAGKFEDKIIGIEAAVKDSRHFPEKWAYFNFIGSNNQPLKQAKAFPREACWSCHNPHGAVDNVFVQFYPVLKEAHPVSAH